MNTKKNPVVHFEMPYKDSNRVSSFYARAFGWEMNNLGANMSEYVIATTTDVDANNMITKPGNINGGFFPLSENTAQYPSVVIAVDDIRESMQKIKDAGGKMLGEPADIPGIGSYVSFVDSEGNRVSILQPIEMS
jgi:predicted enzyme related to lactoylglutathione lyase